MKLSNYQINTITEVLPYHNAYKGHISTNKYLDTVTNISTYLNCNSISEKVSLLMTMYYKHLGVNDLYDAIEYIQELYSKDNYELVKDYADTKGIDIITAYRNLYSVMTMSHFAELTKYDYEIFGNMNLKEFNSRYKYYTALELIEIWEGVIPLEYVDTIDKAVNIVLDELSNEVDSPRIIELSNGCYVVGVNLLLAIN